MAVPVKRTSNKSDETDSPRPPACRPKRVRRSKKSPVLQPQPSHAVAFDECPACGEPHESVLYWKVPGTMIVNGRKILAYAVCPYTGHWMWDSPTTKES